MTTAPSTPERSAEIAYEELAVLWQHLPASWTKGELMRLHSTSRTAVLDLFVRERGLAELVHRFFENGLIHCRSPDDFGEMPMPTNLSSLLTLLRAEYASVLAEPELGREELRLAVSASTRLLLSAAEGQVQSLAVLVRRVMAILGTLGLSGTRVVLPELPIGNSIACQILRRVLTRAGYVVSNVRISLPRNESRTKGVRRIDVLNERLDEFGLRKHDLVLYVDEWESGSNFAALCDAFQRCLQSRDSTFLLPVALLREDSRNAERYASFVKQHDDHARPFGGGADLRIVVPPIPSKFNRRSYFFWSEHDRTTGYRKMQFLGSLYSSFNAAIETLHSDRELLLDALRELLEDARRSGKTAPEDMTGADDTWVKFYNEAYDDWVSCRPILEKLEHLSNVADIENVEQSLREVLKHIHDVVRGRPAERCLSVAAFYERHRMRVSVDPENRYHFKNHAAVVTPLEGDLRLFHEVLMDGIYARIDAVVGSP